MADSATATAAIPVATLWEGADETGPEGTATVEEEVGDVGDVGEIAGEALEGGTDPSPAPAIPASV